MTTLKTERRGSALHITFNRPQARNALNGAMVDELMAAFAEVADDRGVRAIVLRGSGGHFCAGGDIKDMAAARGAEAVDGVDPIAAMNRRFGALIEAVEAAPQVVVAVLEGAVLGGGFGMACVSDVALAAPDAKFGLPEATLGVPPAQIALFVARRIGLTQARYLALTGARFDGVRAAEIGLVHEATEDLDGALARVLSAVQGCAPGALAATKRVLLDEGGVSERLDLAARLFAAAARGDEGIEGMTAFIEKRAPAWSET